MTPRIRTFWFTGPRILLVATLLAGAAGGCALGPDYARPPVPEPPTYQLAAPPGESIANMDWWDLFLDPTLQDLIRTAIAENRDLRADRHRGRRGGGGGVDERR
jgi:outer membrane protein TolC